MESDLVKRVLRGVGDLPTIPQATRNVIDLSRNPDTKTDVLREAISADPALSARILRFANSSFFGLPSRITTLGHAIVMLGYKRIEGLAVAALAYSMFQIGGERDSALATSLWEHSVASAIACKTLARGLRCGTEEECFTAALLHDLGKSVIAARIPQAARRLAASSRGPGVRAVEIEGRLLGFNHEDVIRCLLEMWKFPALLVEAAGFHHHPSSAPTHRLQAALVAAASGIATRKGLAVRGWDDDDVQGRWPANCPPLGPDAEEAAAKAIEDAHDELAALK